MDDAQPYVFGRGESGAPVMLSGLDRLGEKLCKRLRGVIEPIVGVKPVMASKPVEMVAYGDWAADVPATASISIFRLAPLKGTVLLRMNAAMIGAFVDRFYGGTGERPHAARAEFTATEDKLIARLAEAVMTNLVHCWAETMHLEMSFAGRGVGTRTVALLQDSDQMALQRFTVAFGRSEEWPIDILLPIVALRGADSLLGPKVAEADTSVDPLWRGRLARQMENITLPARTVLARPSLPLEELMRLKAGDVIPVTIKRSLPLIVGDRVVAHGSIGEQDGRAAFMIEKLN